MYDNNNIQIIKLTNEAFQEFKKQLSILSVTYFEEDEAISFTAKIKDCYEWYIFLNAEAFDFLSSDIQKIVMAHELGHIHSDDYVDEEAADRWALDTLNEKQQKLLKDMWLFRHGKEFD